MCVAEERASPGEQAAVFRSAVGSDRSALMKLAKTTFAGYYGRWHSDPNLPRDKVDLIYSAWVESALCDPNGYVEVAELWDCIVGCSIWTSAEFGEYRVERSSLAMVGPEAQGRGIYRGFLQNGMARFGTSCLGLLGSTHIANVGVQNALADNGWRPTSTRYALHGWFS